MLLAIAQKALPALPISLTVGIVSHCTDLTVNSPLLCAGPLSVVVAGLQALYFIFSGFAASDASLVGKVGAFS